MKKRIIFIFSVCFFLIAGFSFLYLSSSKAVTVPTYPKDKKVLPVSDEFYQSINAFSYQTASALLTGQENNSLYSPISLYYTLSLAATGAKGDTQKEFLSLLHVSDTSKLATECGNLYRLLYQDNEIAKCKIANSLWASNISSFKKNYLNHASKDFFASVFSVDFSNVSTGKAISKWVSENTNGTLSSDENTDPSEVLRIINTVYFYDQWANPFTEPSTTESFHLSNGSIVKTEFMNITENESYYKGDGYARSSLPFLNSGEMIFILPDYKVSFDSLLSSPEKIKELFSNSKDDSCMITWKVPKFSYSTNKDLNDTLKSMGIQKAFEDADFSNMTDQKISLSSVTQKTHIVINETGAEASAVTEESGNGSARPTHKDMILDRPFIYGIRSKDGTLLFMGVCQNPTLNQ